MLGESGQVVEEGSVANNRVALSELSSHYPGALIVMEAGCHSPWVSRLLVSSAQYILGPFAPPSALRQYGLALAAGATARAKKRAVVAVARPYQAFPQQREKMRTNDLERLRCIA